MARQPTPDAEEPLHRTSRASAHLVAATRVLWQEEFAEPLADAGIEDLFMSVEGLFVVLFGDGGANEQE